MKPESINRAIAEWSEVNLCRACGGVGWVTGMAHASDCDGNCTAGHCPVPTQEACPHCSGGLTGPDPDCYHDLNAVHEALANLPVDKRIVFYGYLYSIVQRQFKGDTLEDSFSFALVYATAPQRCEALLRTIGKWEA